MKTQLKIIAISFLALCTQANAQILGKILDKADKAVKKVDDVSRSAKNTINTATNGTVSTPKIGGSGSSNYFDDNSITFSKSSNGASEKNFSSNDNIYAKITLKEPLINSLKNEGKENEPFAMVPVSLIYIIKGEARGEYTLVKIMKSDYDKKTLIFDILAAKGDAKTQYLTGGLYKSSIAKPLSNFNEVGTASAPYGTQKFDFTFGQNDDYHGTFNFTVKNKAEQKMVAQRASDGEDAMSEAMAQDTQLPAQFAKMGKFSDPQLSVANIKKMIQYDGMTILKLVIDATGGNDYNVNKNALDVPILKMTNKPVWVAYKDNGKCFFTKKYFTRNYEGGGRYGALVLGTSTADVVPIACQNIK